MRTTCNNCLDEFEIEAGSIQTVNIEDVEIQYFTCPSCGKKYLILAIDEEMKRLIADREELQKRIKAARLGKFREKTIRRLLGEQDKIMKRQKKLLPELKRRGEELLKALEKEDDHGDQETV